MSADDDAGMGLAVVHADNHVLVVDKPAGLPTVPDATGDANALDLGKAWIKQRHDKPGDVFLGVVHRLDRPVSGLVVFARTSKAAARLATELQGHRLEKLYLGVADGWEGAESGTVEHHLVKDERTNRVRWHARPTEGSKHATTRYAVLARRGKSVLLALEAVTGRPHQLRAACASLGHPLLGDLKYGARVAASDGQVALHAARLAFAHPTRAETLDFDSAPTRDAFAAFASECAAFLARTRSRRE